MLEENANTDLVDSEESLEERQKKLIEALKVRAYDLREANDYYQSIINQVASIINFQGSHTDLLEKLKKDYAGNGEMPPPEVMDMLPDAVKEQVKG